MASIQQEHRAFCRAAFPQSTAKSALHHQWEEISEAYDAMESLPVLGDDHKAALRMELADVGLLCLSISHGLKVELPACKSEGLEAAMWEKLDICKKRKWGKPDADGAQRHIKSSAPAAEGGEE